MGVVQFWVPLVLATPFILTAWTAFNHRWRDAADQDTTLSATIEAAGLELRSGGEIVDVEGALREAAAAVTSLARARWVAIDLAVGLAMTVQVDPGLFGAILREAMVSAICAAPGGLVLVTAAACGGQLHVRVSDDGPGTDPGVREAWMCQSAASIARQGGSIAVEAKQGRGTTVTIRLPSPVTAGSEIRIAKPLVLADQSA